MATISDQHANHLVLYGVSWDSYLQLLSAFADRRLRHSYDEGTLEMMSPLKEHEWTKRLIGRMVEATSLELNIPIQSIGSTTLHRDQVQKGLEPDECYYMRHERQVRHEDDFDPERDPPPDLAIEVDVTRSSVSRMEIYAALGVPEVWRATTDTVTFYRLNRSGKYVAMPRSKALPLLTPDVIERFLVQRKEKNETALVREFHKWVRTAKRKKK